MTENILVDVIAKISKEDNCSYAYIDDQLTKQSVDFKNISDKFEYTYSADGKDLIPLSQRLKEKLIDVGKQSVEQDYTKILEMKTSEFQFDT